jgi:hypothetical protein
MVSLVETMMTAAGSGLTAYGRLGTKWAPSRFGCQRAIASRAAAMSGRQQGADLV